MTIFGKQPAAETKIFFAEDDACPGAAGRQCRGETGGPGADHQHVAMRGRMFVAVGIRQSACRAEPGGAADQRLVDLLPKGRRPHEGLVVEAADEQRREKLVGSENIEIERRPTILAFGLEPVVKLYGRGLSIRLAPRAAPQRDERIGLLRARREDSASAMIFERAPDELDAVGDKRRGERIARIPRVCLSVEAEGQWFVALDEAAGRQPPRFAHGAGSRASTALSMACVRVSRTIRSQERQPWA